MCKDESVNDFMDKALESRSVQRRKAAQKGEPMTEFDSTAREAVANLYCIKVYKHSFSASYPKDGIDVLNQHKWLIDSFEFADKILRLIEPKVLTDEKALAIWEAFDPEKPVPLADMLRAISQATIEGVE